MLKFTMEEGLGARRAQNGGRLPACLATERTEDPARWKRAPQRRSLARRSKSPDHQAGQLDLARGAAERRAAGGLGPESDLVAGLFDKKQMFAGKTAPGMSGGIPRAYGTVRVDRPATCENTSAVIGRRPTLPLLKQPSAPHLQHRTPT